jgi:Fur family ferric uptake transcriptional regulator
MNALTPAERTKAIETAVASLRAAGLRVTQPRIGVFDALLRRGSPATVEQLLGELNDNAYWDVVTVYRCLAVFEELGLVRRSFLNSGTSVWQASLDGTMTYHVACKASGTMTPLEGEVAAELNASMKKVEEMLKARGYTNVGHLVQFFAVSPGAAPAAKTT